MLAPVSAPGSFTSTLCGVARFSTSAPRMVALSYLIFRSRKTGVAFFFFYLLLVFLYTKGIFTFFFFYFFFF